MDRDAVTELTTAPFRAIDPTALADALEGCGFPRSVLSVLDEHLVSLSIPVGDDDDAWAQWHGRRLEDLVDTVIPHVPQSGNVTMTLRYFRVIASHGGMTPLPNHQ